MHPDPDLSDLSELSTPPEEEAYYQVHPDPDLSDQSDLSTPPEEEAY